LFEFEVWRVIFGISTARKCALSDESRKIVRRVLTNRAQCDKIVFVNQHLLPTLAADRRTIIARMVQNGAVRVTELAAGFGVNVATVRRDLKMLEEQGIVRRVHGGAVAPESKTGRTSEKASISERKNPEARIGQTVAEMIDDGETVFLGPGQLLFEVVRCLTAHSRLTIVTNSLEVAHWGATNTPHTLIVTGGQVEGRDLGLVGQLTEAALSQLRADHVILELGGVSAVEGLTDDSLPQAEMARMLLGIGSQVVVLVPVERVGRVAAAYIAPISDVDVVITAREAPSPFLWDLSESGVRVVLA
jgi:DeoR/GlpR family transcriptional regulator of sugar metabolism